MTTSLATLVMSADACSSFDLLAHGILQLLEFVGVVVDLVIRVVEECRIGRLLQDRAMDFLHHLQVRNVRHA